MPPIACSRCSGPIVPDQRVAPLFAANSFDGPVLSQPPIIPTDGSPGRADMSVGDHIEAGSRNGWRGERAELAAFEALLSKCIADALVAEVRREAEAHGLDMQTWLTRDKRTDE